MDGRGTDKVVKVKAFDEVLSGASYQVLDQRYEDPWMLGLVREVFAVTEDYIVYADADSRVSYVAAFFVEGHNDFLGRFQRVQALPVPTLTVGERKHFRAMLGHALSASLELDEAAAEAGLDAAEDYATTQAEKHARLEYLEGAAFLALAFMLTGFLVLASRGPLETLAFDPVTLVMLGLVGGGIGGLLSVGRDKRGPGQFDPSATAHDCQVAGSFRVLYGAISAFLLLAAAHAGVVTTDLLTDGDPSRMMMAYVLLASAGGFLEKRATAVLELVAGQAPASGDGSSK